MATPQTGAATNIAERQQQSQIHHILLVVEYIYLMRFPLLAAVLLAGGLPCGFFIKQDIFGGLFDSTGFSAFTFVVFMEFLLAWSIMVTIRLIFVYGRWRFKSLAELGARDPGDLKWRHVVCFGLIAMPAFVLTWVGSETIESWPKMLGSLLGITGSLFILMTAAFVHFRIEHGGGRTAARVLPIHWLIRWGPPAKRDWEKHRSSFWKKMDKWFGWLPHELTDGLMRDGRTADGAGKRFFRSGHEMAAGIFCLLMILYLIGGFFYNPAVRSHLPEPDALFYLLFLITLATWFYYLAAFVLDRFRLPVLTTLLLLSLVSGLFRTDHIFRVIPSSKHGQLRPGDVIARWDAGPRHGSNKPLIVVATAGGGIQAAAWTAQVLTGLQEKCGDKFSSSLLLVSSVSGGSVGTMYFLKPYDNAGKYTSDQNSLNEVNDNARKSSLSAAGWGLLYPSTLRTTVFAPLIPQYWDSGWELENAWIRGWDKPPNLSEWRRNVELGTRPAVIFNATAAESGQQFLIGSTELATSPDSQGKAVIQFGSDYNGWDTSIATAVRLSATFPYVTPMARASNAPNEEDRVHVADGGYYDNSGLLNALTWLSEAQEQLKGRTVILITIDSAPGSPANGSAWSWQQQLVAPVSTLVSLRTSSQRNRANFESTLVINSLKQNGVSVERVPFTNEGDMPLSWHLTDKQKKDVDKAWKNPALDDVRSGARYSVFKTLGCQIGN